MATKKAELEPAIPQDQEGRVPVFVPRGGPDEPNLYVSVNDYTALLPRGKTSYVPQYVADEIERANRAKEAFWDLSEKKQEESK